MDEDITQGAAPIVDAGCVRFTVFFGVRGPRVFEVPAEVLVEVFGAGERSDEGLLRSFHANEERIVAAARAHRGAPGHGPVRLGAADLRGAPTGTIGSGAAG